MGVSGMAGLLSAVESERDQRLLDLHRDSDPAAFAKLYELHYDRLLRFVRQRVRDWHLAEEITQDAFVRAFGALDQLRDGSRFYPWLTVIAQRLTVDAFRRGGRVSPVAELDGELGVEPAADEHLIAACEAEALEAALGRVRERHRQVLRWQTDGLTYEDIAARLNAPLTTVPPLLFRARQALRREYLALIEAERLSAVPVLGAVLAWSRRWRARGAQFLGQMPEPGMLTANIAGAVVLAGVALGSTGGGHGVGWHDHPAAAAPAVEASASAGPNAPSDAEAAVSPSSSQGQAGPSGSRPGVVKAATPQLSNDPAFRRRAEEHARRSPYYTEIGPIGTGPDPEGDLAYMREFIDQAGLVD